MIPSFFQRNSFSSSGFSLSNVNRQCYCITWRACHCARSVKVRAGQGCGENYTVVSLCRHGMAKDQKYSPVQSVGDRQNHDMDTLKIYATHLHLFDISKMLRYISPIQILKNAITRCLQKENPYNMTSKNH